MRISAFFTVFTEHLFSLMYVLRSYSQLCILELWLGVNCKCLLALAGWWVKAQVHGACASGNAPLCLLRVSCRPWPPHADFEFPGDSGCEFPATDYVSRSQKSCIRQLV